MLKLYAVAICLTSREGDVILVADFVTATSEVEAVRQAQGILDNEFNGVYYKEFSKDCKIKLIEDEVLRYVLGIP